MQSVSAAVRGFSAELLVADPADACAYDPVAAQAALDEGEPPTKHGR